MNHPDCRQVLDFGYGVGEVTALASAVARLRTPRLLPALLFPSESGDYAALRRRSPRRSRANSDGNRFSGSTRGSFREILTLLLLLCAWPGASATQAATADAVVAWGDNSSGQTTIPLAAQSGVTAIAAGGQHTVALKSDGTIVTWGNNAYGQVTGTPAIAAPVSIIANPVKLRGQVLSGVKTIAAGAVHTVALNNDGSVVAWGQIYDGTHYVPPTVPAGLSGVTMVAAGGGHTVALKNDGSVVAWGSLDQTTVPVAAQGGVTAIAAGGGHTVALKNDGPVVAWGFNDRGQTMVPAGLNEVTAIAAGMDHTVALFGTAPLLPYLNARTRAC